MHLKRVQYDLYGDHIALAFKTIFGKSKVEEIKIGFE